MFGIVFLVVVNLIHLSLSEIESDPPVLLKDAELVHKYPDGTRSYRYFLPDGRARYVFLTESEEELLKNSKEPLAIHTAKVKGDVDVQLGTPVNQYYPPIYPSYPHYPDFSNVAYY